MMDGMMNCGGWGMGAIHLLGILLIVLAIAALAKYLFWTK
jgi:hypothetical protein